MLTIFEILFYKHGNISNIDTVLQLVFLNVFAIYSTIKSINALLFHKNLS